MDTLVQVYPIENTTNITVKYTNKINVIFKNILLTTLIAILIIGVFGNILNLIVFGKKKMRKSSTFRFLFYLSCSDLCVLLIAVTDVLIKNTIQFEIRSYSLFSCKFHVTFYLIVLRKGHVWFIYFVLTDI